MPTEIICVGDIFDKEHFISNLIICPNYLITLMFPVRVMFFTSSLSALTIYL